MQAGYAEFGESMSRIKICGLRRPEDIDAVNMVKPEYAGFVFAPGKRQVSRQLAGELVLRLDSCIRKVGVFVNERPENILDTVIECKLDIVQLHGNEQPEYVDELSRCLRSLKGNTECIWKALRVRNEESLKVMANYKVDAILLDTFSQDGYGGTGETFDWSIASRAVADRKIILAGGLNAGNVAQAVRIVRPYCVDVSSGVEVNGFKDALSIFDFIASARNYE